MMAIRAGGTARQMADLARTFHHAFEFTCLLHEQYELLELDRAGPVVVDLQHLLVNLCSSSSPLFFQGVRLLLFERKIPARETGARESAGCTSRNTFLPSSLSSFFALWWCFQLLSR